MFVVLPVAANAVDGNASPENAAVFIVAPKDCEEFGNPVVVQFGIKGMEVAKAGTQTPSTGHPITLRCIEATRLPVSAKSLSLLLVPYS